MQIGRWEHTDFWGPILNFASTQCVCRVDAWVINIGGNPDSYEYYMRIYRVAGDGTLDLAMGTSEVVSGVAIVDDAYLSFTFSTCVDLLDSVDYAFVPVVDTDSDPNDKPEPEGDNDTNYWEWGFNVDNDADATQVGIVGWEWDSSIPYAVETALQATDEVKMKVFSQ